MNKSELEKIKHKISLELQNTIQSIRKYKKLTQPISPENAIGRVSRMDAINNKSVVEAALRKSEEKLKKLKMVKKNISNKDFGICIRCKTQIPIGRLMIIPESTKCVNCA
ncbi:MAG: TraR/DksA family transcriptional regulator [Flavobacteriales bacterium TMED191]|nr:MAG: TraR/DksA family transcriptional regulator [Flavobacteriales bacterium TMED191]|tara:strand:- start:403 stop:732 length:330 start_codon:yes stop_codon:yes gene_type:complete